MHELNPPGQRGSGLVEVLDRVLDKGLVVAGDIKISLADVELLTIRVRLLVCSIDKAEQIGLDWWRYDHHLSQSRNPLVQENEQLQKRVRLLEERLAERPIPRPRARRAPAANLSRKRRSRS